MHDISQRISAYGYKSDLPHTEGVFVPSMQKGVSLQVFDQEIQVPSRHW